MSATFSLARLGKLINKQFHENLKLYTFSILAVFGLLALVFGFWVLSSSPRYQEEETYVIFLIGLFVAGGIFAAMSFNALGSKDKGIYWLGVPATHFEKLLCTIFFSTVMFTLIYSLTFFLVKSIALGLLTGYIKDHPGYTYTKIENFEKGFGPVLKMFIYLYFGVQALYMLGSVYFRRYSFVITTAIAALVIFAFVYYIVKLDDAFLLNHGSWELVSYKHYDTGFDGYKQYSLSPAVVTILTNIARFAWAPVFFLVAWFRLKEKEI